MQSLQNALENQINECLRPDKVIPMLVSENAKQFGLTFTKKQLIQIKNHFKNESDADSIIISLTDKQIREMGNPDHEHAKLVLDRIFANLVESYVDFRDAKIDGMTSIIEKISSDISKKILDRTLSNIYEIIDQENLLNANFQLSIRQVWREPLNLLRCFIYVSDELWLMRADHIQNIEENHFALSLINRMLAKSNQIAKEVLILLENGYADGAMARWRSLHELSVISHFIAQHGEDAAIRYVDHEIITRCKKALEDDLIRQKYLNTSNDPEMIKALIESRDVLINKYGSEFRHDYGWAAMHLGMAKPAFKDLEAALNFDNLRIEYGLASANIHLNHIGLCSPVSQPEPDDLILSGPSNFGLDEPGILVSKSLLLTASSFLLIDHSLDTIVLVRVLNDFCTKTMQSFDSIGLEMASAVVREKKRKQKRQQAKMQSINK